MVCFLMRGESVVLFRVAEEVANHPGVIWTNVISLRREDAERLGYDSAAQWQALLRSRMELLCENYKIDSRNLKWYAAFHNESHHPPMYIWWCFPQTHPRVIYRPKVSTL